MSDSNPFEPAGEEDPVAAQAMRARLSRLNMLYASLWVASIAMIAYNYLGHRTPYTTIAFWVLLASAVGVRLYRTSVANAYNASRGGPFT